MKIQGSRFIVTLLSLFVLIAGSVQSASAQEGLDADLKITLKANRRHVKIGQTITLTIKVTNLGPGEANSIFFGDSLPDPLNYVSSSCSKGRTLGEFCSVDETVAVGESVILTIVATPITNPAKSERRFTSTAFIDEAGVGDPNLRNNTDVLHLRIVGKIP